jgi:hypothetical protein
VVSESYPRRRLVEELQTVIKQVVPFGQDSQKRSVLEI